jgi:pyruvyl transferase EpsI
MKSGLSGVRIEYCPDIVLSLSDEVAPRHRRGIMVCLRKDKETFLAAADRTRIMEIVEAKTDDIVVRDTTDVSLEDCRPDTFEGSLRDFWELIAGRRVVVTDRLHAMIFCVVTGTPVVALPNGNHKIEETYEAWLNRHPYVRFIDSFDATAVANAIDESWDLSPDNISAPDLSPHFVALRRALLDAAGGDHPTVPTE